MHFLRKMQHSNEIFDNPWCVPGRRGEGDHDLRPGPEDLGIGALDPENPAGGPALDLRIGMKERKTESEGREDFLSLNPRHLVVSSVTEQELPQGCFASLDRLCQQSCQQQYE